MTNAWDQGKINDRASELARKLGRTQGRAAAQYACANDLDAPEPDLSSEWAESIGEAGLVEYVTRQAVSELRNALKLDAADPDLIATIIECAQLEALDDICDAYARGFEEAVETVFELA